MIRFEGSSPSVVFENLGTINVFYGGVGFGNIGIYAYQSSGLFHNRGTFTVTSTSLNNLGMVGFQNTDASPVSIINDGIWSVTSPDFWAWGALHWGNGISITNNNLWTVTGDELAFGILTTNRASVTNNGTMIVTAVNGSAAGLRIERLDDLVVINTGEITVNGPGSTYGMLLYGQQVPTPSPNVINSGTITADFAIFSFIPGIASEINKTEFVLNTGTLNGIVDLGLGHDRIDNEGVINGDVFMYHGDDLVDTTLGSINGAVFLEDGNDEFRGSTAADIVIGGAGDDVLSGASGDDFLEGGDGEDTLNGGEGFDAASYEFASGGVVVSLILQGAPQHTGSDGIDTLVSIEDVIGSAFADALTGDANANYLFGLASDDALDGQGGDDFLSGDEGADTLIGGAGNDLLDGGDHNDSLSGGDDADALYGRAGDDTLDGGDGSDTLYGGDGDDVYYVRGASDVVVELSGAGIDTLISTATRTLGDFQENLTLIGATPISGFGNILANTIIGNDAANTLNGAAGADTLSGNSGQDTLNGGHGADTLDGGADNDLLDGGVDADMLNGGDGDDELYGRSSADVLNGDAGNDEIYGGDGADTASGGDGDDLIDGLNHDDALSGGEGADTLYGRQNNDTLNGDAGNDTLYGGDGADTLNGGTDNDLLDGGNGDDALSGGDGADTLYGRQNNDTLAGDGGNDMLYGGDGDDFLAGGDGDDVLEGGNGIDRLNGGLGADSLWGGAGADTFVFDSALGGGNVDNVLYFNVAQDFIELSASIFGTLSGDFFVIGSAATSADHRIIYDATTSALYFDADGDGTGAAVQFATLTVGLLGLSEGNFLGGP